MEQCAVEGLKGIKFDKGIGNSFRGDAVEERDSVPFVDAKETQLLYADAGDVVTLTEAGKRRLRLTKSNLPDWVSGTPERRTAQASRISRRVSTRSMSAS